MMPDDLDDDQLLLLIVTTDREIFDVGMDFKGCDWEVSIAVMRKLGYVGFVIAGSGAPKILDRIRSIFNSI